MRPISVPIGKGVRPWPIASRAMDIADRIAGSVPALELPWMGLPPGSTTDDTAMARNLVRSLTARGELDPDDLVARHLAWYRSGPPDVGAFTRRVLSRVDRGEDASEAARS